MLKQCAYWDSLSETELLWIECMEIYHTYCAGCGKRGDSVKLKACATAEDRTVAAAAVAQQQILLSWKLPVEEELCRVCSKRQGAAVWQLIQHLGTLPARKLTRHSKPEEDAAAMAEQEVKAALQVILERQVAEPSWVLASGIMLMLSWQLQPSSSWGLWCSTRMAQTTKKHSSCPEKLVCVQVHAWICGCPDLHHTDLCVLSCQCSKLEATIPCCFTQRSTNSRMRMCTHTHTCLLHSQTARMQGDSKLLEPQQPSMAMKKDANAGAAAKVGCSVCQRLHACTLLGSLCVGLILQLSWKGRTFLPRCHACAHVYVHTSTHTVPWSAHAVWSAAPAAGRGHAGEGLQIVAWPLSSSAL